MLSSFKSLYVVLMIIAVIIAAGVGFVAGQMTAPGMKETVTITQRITQVQTQTVTVQPAPQPTQPTQEQLLAPIIEAAKKEGKLVIYATLDRPAAEPLLKAFKAKYPFIEVEYIDTVTTTLYNRYVSERAAGAPTADILWSGGPDLQYKLILEGSAQPYRVTMYDKLPEAAKYKDLAYMPDYYLTVIAYNTEKIPKDLVPKSLEDLLRLLTQRKDLFPSRSITMYDIEQSSYGLTITYYLYKSVPKLTQDLMTAAGSIGTILHPKTALMIEMIKTGQALISWGLVANHVFREAEKDPRLGVIVPNDVAILVPNVIFITKEARHPNAAKLFLEFVLSEEGQAKLAEGGDLIVVGENKRFPQLSLEYLEANVKKLIILRLGDPTLDELLKPDIRSSFIAMWKKWMGIG